MGITSFLKIILLTCFVECCIEKIRCWIRRSFRSFGPGRAEHGAQVVGGGRNLLAQVFAEA